MNFGMWIGLLIAIFAVLVFLAGLSADTPGGVGTGGLGGLLGGMFLLVIAAVVFLISWAL